MNYSWDLSLGSGGHSSFSLLSGAIAWYDASTTSTGAIASWTDKSGNGYNATQGTGADQPISTAGGINGRQSVNFVSNDYLTLASSLSLTGVFTMFCVNNTDTTDATRIWLGTGTNAISNKIGMVATNKLAVRIIAGGTLDQGVTYATGNNILTIQRNSANKVDASFNNAVFTRLFSDVAQVGTCVWNSIGIDDATTSSDWQGDIGEIIIYNRALSTAEISIVNRYLSAKWGITI